MKKHRQYFAFLSGAIFALLLLSVRVFSQETVVSENYWSIVIPKAAALDLVDMGQVRVDSSRDSVVTGYLKAGSYPVRIDAITVDAPFVFVDTLPHLPFTIPKNDSILVKFRFKPTALGMFYDSVIIKTQAERLSKRIRGEGICVLMPAIVSSKPGPFCEGDSAVLDAGAGHQKYTWSNGATTRTIIVKTPGVFTVTVFDANGCSGTSAGHTVSFFPQPTQPSLVQRYDTLISSAAAGYQWYRNDTLLIGETAQSLIVKLDGRYAVRTYDKNGCAVVSVPLDINISLPVSTTIALACLANNTFSAGDLATIPLELNGSTNLKSNPSNYTAYLRFNRSLLAPQFTVQSSTIVGSDRVVAVASSRQPNQTQGTLISLPFIVMLGDAASTKVQLDSLVWTDGKSQVTLGATDCEVNVNVCREGGARLFSANGKISLFQNRPNPFNAMTVIEYEVIEYGPTKLAVMDMYGRNVKTLVDEAIKPGKYTISFDAGSLASGTYVAVLQTPTARKIKMMEVVK